MPEKSHSLLKGVLGVVIGVTLISAAIGTSCTANNLQHYAQQNVAADFAPLLSDIDGRIMDGGQINAELLYASYITLFDTEAKYSSSDKASIRPRLVPCFYTVTQEQVPDVSPDGTPVTDGDGHQKYHTETRYHAVVDSGQIFDNIESKFSISIGKSKRDYIVQLSETLTNYGTYSIGGSVSAYASAVAQYCKQYGIASYENLVLAVMQQESGGRGEDPMQASECGYNTKYPHAPNSITDPNYSIQCGVEDLAACLHAANSKSPGDIADISLALQGYNFGNGFIVWAQQRGGYSLQNAVEFSQLEEKKEGWSSYGDINYVGHVLRYYNSFGTGNGSFVYPVQAGKYTISSGYGYRANPTAGGGEFHKGIDLAAPAGTPIQAAASGTVIYAQFGVQPYGGYGNLVVIRHSASLISMYGHCSALLVSVGQAVRQGQEIALVGSTGDATGNHCHFEIRLNGNSVNPMNYLR